MSRRKFDCTGHPCAPHHITDDVWFYVQKDGLVACQHVLGSGTEVAVIPWRLIKRALIDHEKAKERKTA